MTLMVLNCDDCEDMILYKALTLGSLSECLVNMTSGNRFQDKSPLEEIKYVLLFL